MFEHPNIIKYDERIAVYKNFFDADFVEKINKIMQSDQEFTTHQENMIPWYREKAHMGITELFEVWQKISEFIAPTHVIHPQLNMIVLKPGESMFVHEDSPGEGNHEELTNEDTWGTCCVLDYGIIGYFGDFTGGQVYYPELGIEIQPEPGDLVIHGAHSREKHGVREVLSGIRYAYSTFCMKSEKNPGSFYNYGTEEYNDQIKNNFDSWCAPLFKNERTYKKQENLPS
jgi:hypothetical protein